ncbi:uncharacterized protein [Lolium perenne]|uniref:uncharacterized protein n=1 Tax=Lolium perenne TaxID=4522 RepID=UPI0021F60011|nr:uncharacterized protein LOC127336067 [Lolium perenne]
MTPDEIAAKERELADRTAALDAREAALNQQLTAANQLNTANPPNPTAALTSPIQNPTTAQTSNPNTYATTIKLHVPITLSFDDGNYTSWRELFLVALGRYGLTAHVTGKSTPSDTGPDSPWGRDDYTVLSWIYGSVSVDLLNIVMRPGATARTIWGAIEDLFHDNKKHRAIQLEADFRNTPQGDLSISDYCAKLKALADSLGDVGQPISDENLVLTLLRGLNENYAHLRSFLPFQVPFPTFLQTRSALLLEETQKKTDVKNAAATALWACGQSVQPPPGGPRPPPPPPPSAPGGAGGVGRGTGQLYANNNYRGGRGRGGGRGGRGRGRTDSPWQYNPWTGAPTRANLQQQPQAPWQQPPWSPRPWSAPAPGVLGPRPSFPAPQAYAAYGQPSTSYGPQPTPPPSYNQPALDPALVNALNNMQLSGGDWYMDSGASSHMASDPVYLSANPVQHRRTKHIELDIHFVREKVAIGAVCVLHVPSSSQYADIFTKGLPTALFQEFRSSLHVDYPPSSDCGGVLGNRHTRPIRPDCGG